MNMRKPGLISLFVVSAAAACTSGSGNVSINVQGSASALTDGGAISDDGGTVAVDGGFFDVGQGIEVSRARIVIARLSLEGQVADGGIADGGVAADGGVGARGVSPSKLDHGGGDGDHGDDDGDHGDDGEVVLGPFLIDLTGGQIGGDLVQIFDADVPPGTYREIRFVIATVSSDAGVPAAIAALNGASVIIDGTIAEPLSDGGTFPTTFSFVSSLHASQKTEIEMTVAVDSTTHDVTLNVDPSGWFKGPDGSRLDPAFAGNHQAIEDNIERSIRARADDDDHGDRHGGH